MVIGLPKTDVHSSTKKHISTQRITSQSAHDRLNAQRRNRPIAPHLTVYKREYVSSVSALHRITGLLLSGSLYGLATFYFLAPALGIQFDSTTLVTAFGSLPVAMKTALKFCSAMPFTYHAFNGVKHLVWDTGRLLGKVQSGRASWVVLACSVSSSLLLALSGM
jgi:succinate dehydrogenase (ubiquinone) cytochrome b560 subunit